MNRRRGLLILVVFLVPVLLLEAGLRALVAADRLPEAPGHNRSLETSLRDVRRGPVPDVVILGDSVAGRGVEPAVLAEALSAELGRPARVFNLAQPGASLSATRRLVGDLADDDRLPPVVMLVLSHGSLSDVSARSRPPLFDSPAGMLMGGCGDWRDPVELADCLLVHASLGWRWHGRPERIVEALGGPEVADDNHGRPLVRRTDGFFDGGGFETAEGLQRMLRPQLRAERLESTTSDLVVEEFRRLVEDVRAAGSELVVVALPYVPLLDDALDERWPGTIARRQAGLDRLEEEALGAPIVRVSRFGDWWSPEASMDLRHLSPEGATLLTRELWTRPGLRDPIVEALQEGDRSVGPDAAGQASPMSSFQISG